MELNCALIVASFQIFCFKNMSHLGKYKKKYASVQDFKQCHTVKMRSTAKFLLCYKFIVWLFLNKKNNPHETILKAEAVEFFTLENYAPSAYIFSMANWLKVNILQRSVFNYAIFLAFR